MHSIPVENSDRPTSQEANHTGKVRKATRGRENAVHRKQELVKNKDDKIIRYWVQELVRFCPGGEKRYDTLEVKSLKQITRYDHKNNGRRLKTCLLSIRR